MDSVTTGKGEFYYSILFYFTLHSSHSFLLVYSAVLGAWKPWPHACYTSIVALNQTPSPRQHLPPRQASHLSGDTKDQESQHKGEAEVPATFGCSTELLAQPHQLTPSPGSQHSPQDPKVKVPL